MPLVSSEPDTSPAQLDTPPKRAWFFNPYLQIGFSVLLNAAAQIFIKIGTEHASDQSVLAISSLTSGYMCLGIAALVVGLVSWLYALKSVPLTIAFTLAASTQVMVPLGCWIFLGEQISLIRWGGIFLVTFGVLLVAQPLSRIEERL
jgi:drug/metabolite transporter (DMT)-like permease